MSVTLICSAKTANLIKMQFGRLAHVGNHVLDGGQHAPWEGAVLVVVWPIEMHWEFGSLLQCMQQ